MSLFEEIAVHDLKFSVIFAAGVVAFLGASLPVLLLWKSEWAFVVGGLAGVLAAVATGRWLYS